ncbi:MAG: hypothetical protein ACRCSC_08805, partial [Lactococcus garvieae]
LKTVTPKAAAPSFEHVEKNELNVKTVVKPKDPLVVSTLDVKDQLKHFAKNVIEVALPGVDDEHRLLRPAMLEALLEHQPLSRSEFTERIPRYLRQATDTHEAQRFLDSVLAIIDGSNAEYETESEQFNLN